MNTKQEKYPLMTFKEFIDLNKNIDRDTRDTLLVISETHLAIKSSPLIQKLINEPMAQVSVSELRTVIKTVLQRAAQLAQVTAAATTETHNLITNEQNVLTLSLVALNVALSAKIITSLDNLLSSPNFKLRKTS